jgi:signal transduction histidine kinase
MGQGIGLWVTRQLTEAMGGTFKVESQVGVGSTFYLGFAVSLARLDPKHVQVRIER